MMIIDKERYGEIHAGQGKNEVWHYIIMSEDENIIWSSMIRCPDNEVISRPLKGK